jgi:DNA helicase TIP49 (TBP-interacting protein)
MKKAKIVIATICLLFAAVVTVLTSEATTTFSGAIVGIDQAQRTITFQTMNGQTWALALSDSSMLKQEQVAKGDRVKIEIDSTGKITKITKTAELPSSARTDPIP